MARPLVDALAHRDHTRSLLAIVSGGAILSPSIKAEINEKLPEHRGDRRVRRVGDRRERRGRHDREGSALPHERVDDGDHRRRARSRPSASSASSPAAATSRSATTRTRRRPRRRSSSSTACAGRSPATAPSSRTTARSPCSAAVRSASTPVARRSSPKRSRPSLKSHPDVFDAIVVGVPDARFGEAGRRRGRTPRRQAADARRARPSTPAPRSRATRCRSTSSSSTKSPAPPPASPTTAGPKTSRPRVDLTLATRHAWEPWISTGFRWVRTRTSFASAASCSRRLRRSCNGAGALRSLPFGVGGPRSGRALRDRAGAHSRPQRCSARRRRGGSGRHALGGPLPAVPLRDPPLARWAHPRHPRHDRESGPTDGRPRCRPTGPRPAAVHPHARLGPRRVRHRRDVELELRRLLGAGAQRCRHRVGAPARRWPRARLACRHGASPPARATEPAAFAPLQAWFLRAGPGTSRGSRAAFSGPHSVRDS